MRVRGERIEPVLPIALTGAVCGAAFLRGLKNIEECCIIRIAGFNLGLLLSALVALGSQVPANGEMGEKQQEKCLMPTFS